MSHARSEYEDFKRIAPDAYDLVLALGQVAAKAGLDKQLLELVKLRASQINGCAFCVQHHVLLSERLGWAGWLGCAVMLTGIVLAEPAAASSLRRFVPART